MYSGWNVSYTSWIVSVSLSVAPNMKNQNLVNKTFTNSFLWDYYYNYDYGSSSNRKDKNEDIYQEYYHFDHDGTDSELADNRVMNGYAYFTVAKPYIIGFPSKTYYEFDLKGEFEPENTFKYPDQKIAKLDRQVITFASEPGITINVSDTETGNAGVSASKGSVNYTFKPNYLNAPEVETGNNPFILNTDGNSYVEDASGSTTLVEAFRPYFVAATQQSGRTRSIVFGQTESKLGGDEHSDRDLRNETAGTLDIYAKRKKIIVESSLSTSSEVRIVNVAGITLNTFTIEPGETVETRVNTSGVYIVQTTDSRYTKKVAVK